MTDKEIIDDIDVSECKFLWKEKLPKKVCNNGNLDCDCNSNLNCYFKQLKRKESDTKDFAILHNSFIEIEGLVKNFCEDCSEYERCDYEKDGCYYSILPRLKDIIKKVKEK